MSAKSANPSSAPSAAAQASTQAGKENTSAAAQASTQAGKETLANKQASSKDPPTEVNPGPGPDPKSLRNVLGATYHFLYALGWDVEFDSKTMCVESLRLPPSTFDLVGDLGVSRFNSKKSIFDYIDRTPGLAGPERLFRNAFVNEEHVIGKRKEYDRKKNELAKEFAELERQAIALAKKVTEAKMALRNKRSRQNRNAAWATFDALEAERAEVEAKKADMKAKQQHVDKNFWAHQGVYTFVKQVKTQAIREGTRPKLTAAQSHAFVCAPYFSAAAACNAPDAPKIEDTLLWTGDIMNRSAPIINQLNGDLHARYKRTDLKGDCGGLLRLHAEHSLEFARVVVGNAVLLENALNEGESREKSAETHATEVARSITYAYEFSFDILQLAAQSSMLLRNLFLTMSNRIDKRWPNHPHLKNPRFQKMHTSALSFNSALGLVGEDGLSCLSYGAVRDLWSNFYQSDQTRHARAAILLTRMIRDDRDTLNRQSCHKAPRRRVGFDIASMATVVPAPPALRACSTPEICEMFAEVYRDTSNAKLLDMIFANDSFLYDLQGGRSSAKGTCFLKCAKNLIMGMQAAWKRDPQALMAVSKRSPVTKAFSLVAHRAIDLLHGAANSVLKVYKEGTKAYSLKVAMAPQLQSCLQILDAALASAPRCIDDAKCNGSAFSMILAHGCWRVRHLVFHTLTKGALGSDVVLSVLREALDAHDGLAIRVNLCPIMQGRCPNCAVRAMHAVYVGGKEKRCLEPHFARSMDVYAILHVYANGYREVVRDFERSGRPVPTCEDRSQDGACCGGAGANASVSESMCDVLRDLDLFMASRQYPPVSADETKRHFASATRSPWLRHFIEFAKEHACLGRNDILASATFDEVWHVLRLMSWQYFPYGGLEGSWRYALPSVKKSSDGTLGVNMWVKEDDLLDYVKRTPDVAEAVRRRLEEEASPMSSSNDSESDEEDVASDADDEEDHDGESHHAGNDNQSDQDILEIATFNDIWGILRILSWQYFPYSGLESSWSYALPEVKKSSEGTLGVDMWVREEEVLDFVKRTPRYANEVRRQLEAAATSGILEGAASESSDDDDEVEVG
ncbi:Hypothetical Protein FCC1311_112092, partial [Hondaea fermentalgiana]